MNRLLISKQSLKRRFTCCAIRAPSVSDFRTRESILLLSSAASFPPRRLSIIQIKPTTRYSAIILQRVNSRAG